MQGRPEVTDDGPEFKYIHALILLTGWEPFLICLFRQLKGEIDELTHNSETDEDYLTVLYPRSVFREDEVEGGRSDAARYLNAQDNPRIKVSFDQLPCLLIEDEDTGFPLKLPNVREIDEVTGNRKDKETVQLEVITMFRHLADAAREAHSAAELKEKYDDRVRQAQLHRPTRQPDFRFDWNAFVRMLMQDYKAIIITLTIFGIFGFLVLAIPIGLALAKVPPMYFGGAFLILLITGLLVLAAPRIRQYGLNAPAFAIHVVLGLISAAVLFGILQSSGVFKGRLYQNEYDFGGAASVFLMVVFLGQASERRQSGANFSVTFFAHEGKDDGALITQVGHLTLQIQNAPRVPLQRGSATVGGVPAGWNGKKAKVAAEVTGYKLEPGSVQHKLAPDGVYHLVLKKG